jgi:hypothetical protein
VIANSAFLAAMILLVTVFLVGEQLVFLAPHKRVIFEFYRWHILAALVVVFLNLFCAIYLIGKALFLKDTGRKLTHIDKLLQSPDTVLRDLSERLAKDE